MIRFDAQEPGQPTFKLSKHVQDPDLYKLITQLPKAEVIQSIDDLPPYTANLIRTCFINIYSYVTQRDYVENRETFFIHVCGTVFYESSTNILIKEKDHAKKAANIYQMVQGTLKELREKLSHYPLNELQKEILASLIKLLESHEILFKLTLDSISEDKKQHLKEFQGLDLCKAPKELTPIKRKVIRAAHPSSPLKEEGTPKKLSQDNKISLGLLAPPPPPKRRKGPLFEEDLAQEKQVDAIEYSDEDEPDLAQLGKLLKKPAKVEKGLEEYLTDHMDSLLRFTPTQFTSNPSNPAKQNTKKKKAQFK